ncbi:RNA polymerase I-specific transcription initiation factor RRN6-like protein [Scheffersomyces amazonensis]|uniref:RNA polymerase I-specific transcription initiation factor RRN6-like protein n=1 Tax=Scheffersomyces amazonensis TaxID=1078765 RepID=UPI00315D4C30
MWPSKKGLGVRLSYGVSGNGSGVSGLSSEVEFARRDGPHEMYEIHQSLTNVVEGQVPLYSNPELQESVKVSVSSIEGFIPSNIVSSLHHESDVFTSSIAHDPNFRNLLKIVGLKIKSTNKQSSCLAVLYPGGASGNVLNISKLTYMSIDAVKENNKYTSILMPDLATSYQITFTSQIKQIETPPTLSYYVSSYLVVRTNFKIYVLDCCMNDEGIDIQVISEIDNKQLSGFEFADVRFNPFDDSQFGLVDIKGNFGIWTVSPQRVSKLNLGQQSIYDTKELSNWKRIIWSQDSHKVLVLSRTCMEEFDIATKQMKRIITSNTWSRIQDCQRVENEDYAFLLTSKELIWLKLKGGIERMISWKHFLDDSDPSLQLSVSVISHQHYTCTIFSEANPLIFVYTFAIENGKPYSVKDPYCIKRGEYPGSLKQALFIKVNFNFYTNEQDSDLEQIREDDEEYIDCDKYVLFELSSCLGLTIRAFSTEPGFSIKNDEEITTQEPEEYITRSNQSQYFDVIPNIHIRNIVEALKVHEDQSSDSSIESQKQSLQTYAYSLGEGVSRFDEDLASYLSLLDISDNIPSLVEDIAELDTMLEQLDSFYKSKDIQTNILVNTSLVKRNLLLNSQDSDLQVSTAGDLYQLLNRIYCTNSHLNTLNTSTSLLRACMQLSTGLIKSKSTNLTTKLNKHYNETLEASDDQVKSLIDNWDSHDLDGRTESQATIIDSQPVMPTLVLSQRQRVQSQSQSVHVPSPLSQSTVSSTHNTHSQSQRLVRPQSQSSQRRKKRKGGFA